MEKHLLFTQALPFPFGYLFTLCSSAKSLLTSGIRPISLCIHYVVSNHTTNVNDIYTCKCKLECH